MIKEMWFVKENDHTVVVNNILNEEEAIKIAQEIHEQHCGRYHEVMRFDLRTGRCVSICLLKPYGYPWITYPNWF